MHIAPSWNTFGHGRYPTKEHLCMIQYLHIFVNTILFYEDQCGYVLHAVNLTSFPTCMNHCMRANLVHNFLHVT